MTNNHLYNGHHLFVITIAALILCFTLVVEGRKLTFKNLECLEHNNDVCGDLACSVGKKQKTMSLGCTMKRPTSEMKVSVSILP